VLRRTVLLGLLAAALVPASAHAGVVATTIGNFTHPTYITSPPGDTHRVFVVEQPGVIEEIKDGGAPTTFLDISSIVTNGWAVSSDPEQGLLSIAFPPDYATTHHFFAYYTTKNCPDSPGCDNVVAEFTATDDDHAEPTPTVLITIPHPGDVNHDAGQLQFGPDGDLYISVGDGGGGDDTHQNSQKTTNLLGKILRIDPGTSSYTIPDGNPFKGTAECTGGTSASNCPEIWWYGLRNPWRFSFDSASGALIVGDVGQSRDEEIDYALPGQDIGGNFGWPCFEGFELNAARPAGECATLPSPVINPVLVYHHSSNCGGAAFCGPGIIGGYVAHDPSLPSIEGCYVFGDLGNSRLQLVRLAQPNAVGQADLGPHVSNLSSFGVDASGHLYAADVDGGNVYRLDSDGNAATDPSCPPAPPGTPGGGAPPPAGTDKAKPSLTLRDRRRQRVLRTHSISVGAVSNELATFSATATVKVGKVATTLRFKRVTRTRVAAGRRVTLKLGLSKRTLRSLRRSMTHHRTRVARVTVTARDTASNARSRRVTIRLVH
jgi:glucose/arabinose dehydrogenase